jgi:hypothetical protein
VELTRALTTLENARMEWNASRLKFPVLSGELPHPNPPASTDPKGLHPLTQYPFIDLCRIGFALTWPLALMALIAFVTLLVFLMRR